MAGERVSCPDSISPFFVRLIVMGGIAVESRTTPSVPSVIFPAIPSRGPALEGSTHPVRLARMAREPEAGATGFRGSASGTGR